MSFFLTLPSSPRKRGPWTAVSFNGRSGVSVGSRFRGNDGELRACLRPGPVEPGAERCDIGRLDRTAAPDPQTRRGVAIAGDVIGRIFDLEQAGDLLDQSQ